MRLALTLAAALVAAPAAAPLEFDDPEAEAYFEEAQKAFSRKDWAAARDALLAAYELEPRPRLLFAAGQAARLASDWTTAADLYDRFIDTKPAKTAGAPEYALYCRGRAAEEEQRCKEADQLYSQYLTDFHDGPFADEVIDRIGQCVPADVPEPPPPGPKPRVVAPKPKPAVDETPPPKPPRPWHRDPLGGIALGVGLASLGTGVGLMVGADADYDAAPFEGDHARNRFREDRAITMQTAGIVMLSVGGALVLTAVIRYAVVARKNKKKKKKKKR